jgi:hypothetical protein
MTPLPPPLGAATDAPPRAAQRPEIGPPPAATQRGPLALRHRAAMLTLLLAGLPGALGACRTAPPAPAPGPLPAPPESSQAAPSGPAADLPPELAAGIERLYRAFDFEAGSEPDWAAMRALFHPDCRFLGPVTPGREPRSESLEQFLESFRRYATGSERATTGLFERVLWIEPFRFGGVAQTAVAFEGHQPGAAPAETRGIDLLHWVETPAGWRIVGFSSQYERPGLPLPTGP